jgi:ferric-dicitrate binding protein FerR (iron transport regulator)
MALEDALPELSRWYNLDFKIADRAGLADRRITATFDKESVSQLLTTLTISLDLRAERRGQTVLLFPRRGPRLGQ